MDKRAHLVKVAFDLFYEHGVHAVGINRVLTESGVAKKTLYHHFPGKEDLVAATVDYRDQQFVQWLEGRLLRHAAGRDALLALFDALDDWFNERDASVVPFHGCFFINVSAEFGAQHHPVHRLCSSHKKRVENIIAEHATRIGSTPDQVERITQTCVLLKEGAIVQAHVAGDGEAAIKARGLLEVMLDTLARQ